jgi:hypothetical protein
MASEQLDLRDQIAATAEQLIGSLEGRKLSAASLDVPPSVPTAVVEEALAPYNDLVDQMINSVTEMRDEAIGSFGDAVDGMVEWANAKVDELEFMVAEGGDVETALRQSRELVVAKAAEFMAAVEQWKAFATSLDPAATAAALRTWADRVEAGSNESRPDEFREWVATEGQARVDAWKANHAAHAESLIHPTVPEHEVEAVERAHAAIEAALQARTPSGTDTEDLSARADEAYATAVGLRGQRSRDALVEFWEAANELAAIANEVGA